MREVTFERLDSGKLRRVKKERVVVGASAGADVRFGHPSVLAEHAYVRVESGRVDILAAGDEAVVEVEGIVVDGIVALRAGQTVRVGQVEFRVWFDEVPEDVSEEATVQSFSREAVLKAAGRRRSAKGTPDAEPSSKPVSEGGGRASTNANLAVHGARERSSRGVDSKPRIQDGPGDTESLPSVQVSDGLQASKAVVSDSGESPPPEAIAATQLLSAFEAIDAARRRQAGLDDSNAATADPDAATAALNAVEPDVPQGSGRETVREESPVNESNLAASKGDGAAEVLQVGSASEYATQALSSGQVEALYKLYEKRRRDAAPDPEVGSGVEGGERPDVNSEDVKSGDALKLSQILRMGPEAFGVKTWDEVAEAAATFEPEDDPAYGLALLRNADSGSGFSRVMVVAGALLGLSLLVLVLLIPAEPPSLDENEPITDFKIQDMERVDHAAASIRCHEGKECLELARREFEVAKTEWDTRFSSYEKRYRAFEHADRARVLLEKGGLELDALEGLEAQRNLASDELDAIYQSLRVSFFIALSRNSFEDALELLNLTRAYFPSHQSREWRWARHLHLALKARGIETQVAHKRSVDGRWDR